MKRLAALTIASAVMVTMGTPAVAGGNKSGWFDHPYDGYAPKTTLLRDSTPAAAGLDPAPIDAALTQVAGWTQPSGTQLARMFVAVSCRSPITALLSSWNRASRGWCTSPR